MSASGEFESLVQLLGVSDLDAVECPLQVCFECLLQVHLSV